MACLVIGGITSSDANVLPFGARLLMWINFNPNMDM